tara:strand:+ start:26290 stop:27903 length:1614 start_codon:yes stop_codon:yes gene_type:complete
MAVPQKHQRLMELIGLVRDGGLDDSQTRELETILENDPNALQYYVESIDLAAMLHRQQGMTDSGRDTEHPQSVMSASVTRQTRGWWAVAGWSTALCASLAVGVLLGGKLLSVDQPPGIDRGSIAGQPDESEIATLSFANDCRWGSDDQPRHEGQRLKAETLHLAQGVAVVQFDSDVRLVIEGPTQLELASVDRAMLRYGTAVFSGEGDLDRFTLETPFSKIQDEGTEFAVSVNRSGEVAEVHVFDGRVTCVPPEQKKTSAIDDPFIQIGAGDARRITETGSVETIQLASNRFVRAPVAQSEPAQALLVTESFAYDTESLIGQSGGTGWLQPWTQELQSPDAPEPTLRTAESVQWPGREKNGDGSLLIASNAGLSRMLQHPIDMNRDAAYYLSFLVRKLDNPEETNAGGWAYFTLRNSEDRAGKISFGPITQRGPPRIAHDGRIANAVSRIRENVVYLFVCKILARQDKDDSVQVRIYGDHETVDLVEPSTWNVTTRPIRSDSILDTFRVSTKNSVPILFDELLIGKTWGSVTSPYSD